MRNLVKSKLTDLGYEWVGLIGVILQTTTFSATQMIIGRILLGMGNGIISGKIFLKSLIVTLIIEQPLFLHSSKNHQLELRKADLKTS